MKRKGTKTSGKANSKSSKNGSTAGTPALASGQVKVDLKDWSSPTLLNKSLLAAGELRPTLSYADTERLAECEATIQRGWKTFVDVGNALLTIRDNNLYRDTHKDFDAYCRDKWQYQRAYAYRLMSAATTVKALSPIGDTKHEKTIPFPSNESQVRPMVNLKPEEAREVWISAVKQAKDGPVTAKLVLALVKSLQNPKAKSPPKKNGKAESKHRSHAISRALDDLERVTSPTPVAAKCRRIIANLREWLG